MDPAISFFPKGSIRIGSFQNIVGCSILCLGCSILPNRQCADQSSDLLLGEESIRPGVICSLAKSKNQQRASPAPSRAMAKTGNKATLPQPSLGQQLCPKKPIPCMTIRYHYQATLSRNNGVGEFVTPGISLIMYALLLVPVLSFTHLQPNPRTPSIRKWQSYNVSRPHENAIYGS